MEAVHDRGGRPGAGPIDRSEHPASDWEMLTDAILIALASPERRIMRVDELRRAIESLRPQQYESFRYYERWITAIEQVLIEKGLVSREEIDAKVVELGRREP
ncbi:MAG: nitrile hydratase subunit beta [Candidatus Rokubacteria bacterium]|nr:nitrile hydratase subunit beta [Candidatus Rokubacteria bacterium]